MNACTPVGGTRMIRGKGRFVNRPGISKNKEYPKYFVYVPIEVARDSNFPFNEGDEVEVIIEPMSKRIVIEKPKTEDKQES